MVNKESTQTLVERDDGLGLFRGIKNCILIELGVAAVYGLLLYFGVWHQ